MVSLPPAETPGDHEVHHEEQIVIELHDNTLAQAPDSPHRFSLDNPNGWLDRSNNERTRDPHLDQSLTHHKPFEGLYVDCDIGQFWHYSFSGLGGTAPYQWVGGSQATAVR